MAHVFVEDPEAVRKLITIACLIKRLGADEVVITREEYERVRDTNGGVGFQTVGDEMHVTVQGVPRDD